MDQGISAKDFGSRLIAERDALKSLIEILETEQKCLIDGDTDKLLDLSDRKTNTVHAIAKLASSRKDDLLLNETEIKAQGIIAWLQHYDADSLPIWTDIQYLAEQMQNLNRTNGILIQTKLRHNQQALAVLLNATNNTHGLYGADGQPHLRSSSRILGSV